MSVVRQKKNKRLRKKLENIAGGHASLLMDSETWGNGNILGLSSTQNKIVFIRKTSAGCTEGFIELDQVSKCQINNSGSSVKTTSGIKVVNDKIELQFLSADRKITDSLELYTSDYDTSAGIKELELAEKWNHRINEFLSGK